MRLLLIFACSLLLTSTSYCQKAKWQKIDQSFYGMKYELPKDWEIDGFGSSSVCHCAGTINSVDRFSKNEIGMVVYPALSDSALYNGMRTEVWNWKFQENETRTTFKAKSLTFEKTVSKWVPESLSDTDSDNEVWRYTTSFKNQYYVIYFWGSEKMISKKEKMILEILNRFKAVRVKLEDSKYW